ncbi:MAG: hypothetical protein KIS81_12500 [Maricaulaceae bacterium]|nr:hypothetical protein [Maricaulaceae bacterium]
MLKYLMPETYTAPPAARRRYAWRTTTMFLIAIALIFYHGVSGGEGAPGLPDHVLVWGAMALFCGASYEFWRLVAALDELQRRLHVNAAAASGLIVLLVLAASSLAAMFTGAPRLEAFFGLPMWALIYYAALFVFSRRYS